MHPGFYSTGFLQQPENLTYLQLWRMIFCTDEEFLQIMHCIQDCVEEVRRESQVLPLNIENPHGSRVLEGRSMVIQMELVCLDSKTKLHGASCPTSNLKTSQGVDCLCHNLETRDSKFGHFSPQFGPENRTVELALGGHTYLRRSQFCEFLILT